MCLSIKIKTGSGWIDRLKEAWLRQNTNIEYILHMYMNVWFIYIYMYIWPLFRRNIKILYRKLTGFLAEYQNKTSWWLIISLNNIQAYTYVRFDCNQQSRKGCEEKNLHWTTKKKLCLYTCTYVHMYVGIYIYKIAKKKNYKLKKNLSLICQIRWQLFFRFTTECLNKKNRSEARPCQISWRYFAK